MSSYQFLMDTMSLIKVQYGKLKALIPKQKY